MFSLLGAYGRIVLTLSTCVTHYCGCVRGAHADDSVYIHERY